MQCHQCGVQSNSRTWRQFVNDEKIIVSSQLQNNEIIIVYKISQDYIEHLSRYLFTKIINRTSIIISFSAIPIVFCFFN